MLNIRLQRTGKRGQAYFRIIIAEHTKKPKGSVLELLGSYDPHKKELKVEKDRIEYWISKGAQISPTVNNLLVNQNVWDKPKMASWKPKKKPTTNDQQPTTKKETTAEQKPEEEPKKEETSVESQPVSDKSSGEAKPETAPAV